MNAQLLRFNNTVPHDPAIDAWFYAHPGDLGQIAHHWFQIMRASGDEVREVFHDNCANACLGDVAFAYVNIFTSHVNVGFFRGADLPDPAQLLEGTGKSMRHIKLKPDAPTDATALNNLIAAAYADIKQRIEHG